VDAVLICLLIQEIEHVLDGQGERAAAVHGAEQRLEQVVHKFLQRALMGAATEKVKGGTGARPVKQPWKGGTPGGVASSARPRKAQPRGPREYVRLGSSRTLTALPEDPGGMLRSVATHGALTLYF